MAEEVEPKAMQFVVLHHTDWPGRGDHFDLLLEWEAPTGRVLKTFATLANEFPAGRGECVLRALAHHRIAYLDHEGPVSNGRGQVLRADSGTYFLRSGLASEDLLRLAFVGTQLKGDYVLTRNSNGKYEFQKIG